MMCFRGGVSTVMIAIYGPLILMTLTMMNADHSESHELRPSDHGLEFQTNTPSSSDSEKSPPPEMMSFFGNSSSTSSDVAMPKALNSNSSSSSAAGDDDDTSWWGNNAGRGKSKDHVRDVLLVGSVACGLTGVVLLVISALLYIFKFRKQRSPSPLPQQQPPPPTLALPSSAALSCHDNDSGNKLQIVVRDSY
ncbi:uncharacterized protein LOC126726671 [Quercus robur]|uniref:uncharacterized protein LOC126726671 n=1 Tax=Quercus robur TaxID=38942 RepID=UPI00216222D0|nr:uncharacterized protein LOC126726671 [Quercus robur]